jgi:hypothetical protein
VESTDKRSDEKYWTYKTELDVNDPQWRHADLSAPDNLSSGNTKTPAGINVYTFVKTLSDSDFTKTTDPDPLSDISIPAQIIQNASDECGSSTNVGGNILIAFCSLTNMFKNWAMSLLCFAQDQLVNVLGQQNIKGATSSSCSQYQMDDSAKQIFSGNGNTNNANSNGNTNTNTNGNGNTNSSGGAH